MADKNDSKKKSFDIGGPFGKAMKKLVPREKPRPKPAAKNPPKDKGE